MTGAYGGNIEKIALENTNFRNVLYTSKNQQLVVMSLKPLQDIGMEIHDISDQFIRIEKGTGIAIVNGNKCELKEGIAIIIPKGTEHNIINTSNTEEMKLYSIYSPPHHKQGTIHKIKPIE